MFHVKIQSTSHAKTRLGSVKKPSAITAHPAVPNVFRCGENVPDLVFRVKGLREALVDGSSANVFADAQTGAISDLVPEGICIQVPC